MPLLEAIIRKTCRELYIEIIDIAVNPDHFYLLMKYPPKYSLSFIAKRIKGMSIRVLTKELGIISGLQAATTVQ